MSDNTYLASYLNGWILMSLGSCFFLNVVLSGHISICVVFFEEWMFGWY
jgi:hypothetical protein